MVLGDAAKSGIQHHSAPCVFPCHQSIVCVFPGHQSICLRLLVAGFGARKRPKEPTRAKKRRQKAQPKRSKYAVHIPHDRTFLGTAGFGAENVRNCAEHVGTKCDLTGYNTPLLWHVPHDLTFGVAPVYFVGGRSNIAEMFVFRQNPSRDPLFSP